MKRNRTIRWEEEIDAIAVRLAAERKMPDGSVSELLSQLVIEERDNPRLDLAEPTSGYKDFIRRQEAENSKLAAKISKKDKK